MMGPKSISSMNEPALTSRAPFAGYTFAYSEDRGVLVSDRDGLGIATVLVRKGQIAALTRRVHEQFGIELPHGPQRRATDAVAFAGIGPEAWLATSERDRPPFVASLREKIGDLASVTDQSGGYAVLRITGPKVRNALAKILPIDLHPRAFKQGDVASTMANHLGVTLWRLADATDGASVFDIALFRSFAGSFWHALTTSTAEFGLAMTINR